MSLTKINKNHLNRLNSPLKTPLFSSNHPLLLKNVTKSVVMRYQTPLYSQIQT